jgi:hypothetical protein
MVQFNRHFPLTGPLFSADMADGQFFRVKNETLCCTGMLFSISYTVFIWSIDTVSFGSKTRCFRVVSKTERYCLCRICFELTGLDMVHFSKIFFSKNSKNLCHFSKNSKKFRIKFTLQIN